MSANDRPSPGALRPLVSALVLAASDAALLAIAVSPFSPPNVPEDLSLSALAHGALAHLRGEASSLKLSFRKS